MFAFGEKFERTCKDFATERARIKKGKVLGRTGRSVAGQVTQTSDRHLSVGLPNVTTTQLAVRKKETGGMHCPERKSVHQIAKQGRLRDSAFMLEDNGLRSCVDELQGLFVSKLNFNKERNEDFAEKCSSGGYRTPRKQQHSRLSKCDSGFFEDSGDDLVPLSAPGSPNEYPERASNNSVTASEKRRKITLDFKDILNQDKAVVRNTERLNVRPTNMCLQSQQSLHADLIAFKSLPSIHHEEAISNFHLQANEHFIKLREVVLKTKPSIFDDGIKQSDTSLAVLKTRRRLPSERNSTCLPYRRNKERAMDLNRATYNSKRRIDFSDAERRNYRQCESCPVVFHSSRAKESQSRSDLGNSDTPATNCAVSATSGLTD